MVNTTQIELRPALRSAGRRAGRSALARPGLVVLGLGLTTMFAGAYRAVVELSRGRLHPLVPVAVGAPLAAELLLLVAVFVLASGALLIAASRQRKRS